MQYDSSLPADNARCAESQRAYCRNGAQLRLNYLGVPLLRLPPDFPSVVLGQPPASPGPLPAPAPGRAPPLELPPVVLCRAPVLVPPPLPALPLVPLLPMTRSSQWRPHGRATIVFQPCPGWRESGLRGARADHERRRRAAGVGRRRRHRVGFQIGPLSPGHRQAQRLKRWACTGRHLALARKFGRAASKRRRRKGVVKRHPHDRRRISSAVVIPWEFFTGAVRPPRRAFPAARRSAGARGAGDGAEKFAA